MSARCPRSAAVLLTDPAFAEMKSLIVQRTGHHYYTDKDEQLAERITKQMSASGIDEAAIYLARLRDPLGEHEWRELESELTIKETFFFRFAEQFAALRTTILPRLIEARSARRRLRIWSAGCSTGAEPYSIAIVLSELLGSALSDWQVSILGTDIDERALTAGREAIYSSWSLRTMAPAERERLFIPEERRWRLRPAYRGMVRFERLNILDLGGAAVPLQFSDYDLILCRNMLIYFHPDQAALLVDAIGECLTSDGWLLLGHAEAGLATASRLVGFQAGGVIAYRRAEAIPAVVTRAVMPVAKAISPSRSPPRRPMPLPAPVAPLARLIADANDLDEIRGLLDAGEVDAASFAISRLRNGGRESARLLFLDAMCALAREDRAAAERALRGALYLDGGFAMAHYLLAQALVASGRTSSARHAFVNAAKALAEAAPEASVAESDGRTAADLRNAVWAGLEAIDAT